MPPSISNSLNLVKCWHQLMKIEIQIQLLFFSLCSWNKNTNTFSIYFWLKFLYWTKNVKLLIKIIMSYKTYECETYCLLDDIFQDEKYFMLLKSARTSSSLINKHHDRTGYLSSICFLEYIFSVFQLQIQMLFK